MIHKTTLDIFSLVNLLVFFENQISVDIGFDLTETRLYKQNKGKALFHGSVTMVYGVVTSQRARD